MDKKCKRETSDINVGGFLYAKAMDHEAAWRVYVQRRFCGYGYQSADRVWRRDAHVASIFCLDKNSPKGELYQKPGSYLELQGFKVLGPYKSARKREGDEERHSFIESVFGVLEDTGLMTLDEINASWITTYPAILQSLKNLPKERRDEVIRIFGQLLIKYRKVLGESAKETVKENVMMQGLLHDNGLRHVIFTQDQLVTVMKCDDTSFFVYILLDS